MKKVIIAGSRSFTDYDFLENVMLMIYGEDPFIVICGGARGADSVGESFAEKRGYPIYHYYAEWEKYGKSAGYNRNVAMADVADEAVVFWDGISKGSAHMIRIMQGIEKPVQVILFKGEGK